MEPTTPTQPTQQPSMGDTPAGSPTDPMMKQVSVSSTEGVTPASVTTSSAASPQVLNAPPITSTTSLGNLAEVAPASSAPQVNPGVTPLGGTPTVSGVTMPPLYGGSGGMTSVPTGVGGGSAGNKKKWLVPVVGAVVAVVLLGGGYVFGFYLPNRPQTVFTTSLSRSADAADLLVTYAKDQMSTGYAGAIMDGTLNVKSSNVSYDAKLQGKTDGKNMNMLIDANIAGEKMNLELRSVDVASSENPDMYLKLSGIKSLLQSSGMSQLSSYDDQWIAIDHTLLDTYTKQVEESVGANAASLGSSPTPEQLNDAIAKIQSVNKTYLFTDSEDKAVLVYKDFVGKETVDARSVYHYTVGYSKPHLKAYIDALGKALDSSKLDDWVTKQNGDVHLSALLDVDGVKKSIDEMSDSETFDMNVDAKTKIIQGVTFTDKTSEDNAKITIAQQYTSGSTYPFSLHYSADGKYSSADVTVGMTVDTKSNKVALTTKGDLGYGGGSDMTVDLALHMTPSKDTVKVSAPTGAKPVMEIMKQLGIDQNVLGAQTNIPSSLLNLNKL